MSEGGVVGAGVAMGVTYWIAVGLAEAIAVAVVGAAIATVVLAVVVVLGVITYARSFRGVIGEGDMGWALDHGIAPLLAAVAVWVFFPVFNHTIASWVHLLHHLDNGGSLIGPLIGLCLGIGGIFVIVCAPALAVSAMGRPSRIGRIPAYIGFFVTGGYWGTMTMMITKAGHLRWPG